MFFVVFLMVLTLPFLLVAQEQTVLKANFSTLAVFKDSNRKFKGYLVELQDSMLLLSESRKLTLPYRESELLELEIPQVEVLKIRKNSNSSIGAAAGLAVGMVVGAVVATSTKAEEGNGFENLVYGVEEAAEDLFIVVPLSTIAGAAIGLLIGSKRKPFVINGQQDKYDELREQLKRYVMRKH